MRAGCHCSSNSEFPIHGEDSWQEKDLDLIAARFLSLLFTPPIFSSPFISSRLILSISRPIFLLLIYHHKLLRVYQIYHHLFTMADTPLADGPPSGSDNSGSGGVMSLVVDSDSQSPPHQEAIANSAENAQPTFNATCPFCDSDVFTTSDLFRQHVYTCSRETNPPTSHYNIPKSHILDDEGDIILRIAPSDQEDTTEPFQSADILVDSRVLKRYSPYFRDALTPGRFLEGRQIPQPGYPVVMNLYNDNEKALLFVLRYLHGHYSSVQKLSVGFDAEDLDFAFELALLFDKYRLDIPFYGAGSGIINQPPGGVPLFGREQTELSMLKTQKLLFVAWVFGLDRLFRLMADWIICNAVFVDDQMVVQVSAKEVGPVQVPGFCCWPEDLPGGSIWESALIDEIPQVVVGMLPQPSARWHHVKHLTNLF